MVDFANLKKSSGSAALQRLSEELDKANSKFTNKDNDERFWRPELDKSGNGSAVIRFLPPTGDESVPWVKVFKHAFKGPGGSWYIEKSLTTIGAKDPVSEHNSELWASGIDANKEVARKQKRRLKYISNVLVVKDPANPENDGKVFLFEYGTRIFDKINDLMNPENVGLSDNDIDFKKPVNPFDLWQGAHFRLRVRQVEGYPNYDKSEFGTPCPAVEGGDEALEALWKKQYALNEFVDPKSFKSYDELKAKLDKVLGLGGQSASKPKTKTVAEASVETKVDEDDIPSSFTDDGDSEDLSFLHKLAQE